MTGDTAPSLTEFARERGAQHSTKAWVKTLPPEIRDEVIAGWKAGLGVTIILEWLHKKGVTDATKGKLSWLTQVPRG